MKVEESRYRASKHRIDEIKNTGFNYRDNILLKTMDPNILKNINVLGFAQKLEATINRWIFEAKAIKKFSNFFVDKDEDLRIN